jgi:hypothetical protein
MPTPSLVTKSTPVLFAEALEPSVAFWKALGFDVTMSVPHGERLGFAILSNGKVELMYQSFASAKEDVPAVSELVKRGPTFLFVEVDDLDAVRTVVKGAKVYADRKTPYGSTEIGVVEPAGHHVLFARFG